jgi:hypothetical protein
MEKTEKTPKNSKIALAPVFRRQLYQNTPAQRWAGWLFSAGFNK